MHVGDKVRVVNLIDDVEDYKQFIGAIGIVDKVSIGSYPITVWFDNKVGGKETLAFRVEELRLLSSKLMETE